MLFSMIFFQKDHSKILNTRNFLLLKFIFLLLLQANFAKWEPRHGKFRYRHPWAQYLEIGGTARDCAYRIHALNAYLNYETQVTNYIYQTNKRANYYYTTHRHVSKVLFIRMSLMVAVLNF